jgi:endo-1,4-beta-xylanase
MRKSSVLAGLLCLGAGLVLCPKPLPVRGQAPAAQAQPTRTYPKAEWVDPNRGEPNGTKYQTFPSKVLGAEVSYLVYLPPGYEQGTKRYPVIYWLHGLGGNQRAGALRLVPHVDRAIRNGTLPPAIVMSVNGMVTSFYCDWANGQRPIESVIIKDLIPHVDQTYRTIARREGRVIQGYSMGGFGAGHLGFKYPDVFGTVCVDAGALIQEAAWRGPNLAPIFQDAFAGDKDRFLAEHPTQLVQKNADRIRGRARIRIGVGQDDNLLPRNKELHELLEKLKIEHEYVLVPGVGHDAGAYYEKLGAKCLEMHRKVFESLDQGK